MKYPTIRLRRLRKTESLRSMVRETRLHPSDFVLPLFVCTGNRVRSAVESMPGVFQLSIDEILIECEHAVEAGIEAVLLFGIPDTKDDEGRIGYAPDGIVQQALHAVKKRFQDLTVITDVCNCEYTTHGHCGIVVDGHVANDKTLEILARQAVSHAEAGCDMVAPSDMMDGRVAAIRDALDEKGFGDLPIMSYAAKYASSFYGPFRDAADCAPKFGDRRSYQMDPSNGREAIREAGLDLSEGADILMVKPAIAYLDIIKEIKGKYQVPVAGYNVSGEYSMVKAAAEKGWIDEKLVALEMLTSIKRAGADIIITYYAVDAARWITGKK